MENHWYVIKVPYGKAMQVSDYLRTQSVRTFFPKTYRRGDESRRLVPVIHNLCFVYDTEASLRHWLEEVERHFGGAAGAGAHRLINCFGCSRFVEYIHRLFCRSMRGCHRADQLRGGFARAHQHFSRTYRGLTDRLKQIFAM